MLSAVAGCFVFAAVFDSATARKRERAREGWIEFRERENEAVLVLAVMEPGDLQPLTVYNEHAPCAHGHRNPQQSFGVSKEVMRRGQETQVVMLGGTLGFSHHAVVPPHFAGSSSVASLPCGHTTEGWRNGEKIKRKARMEGWRDGGSNSSRFGMDGGRRTCSYYSPPPMRNISWQNEALSAPLHSHNVITELCPTYIKLCSATLHFGVPEWQWEITCVMSIQQQGAWVRLKPLCMLYHGYFLASADTRSSLIRFTLGL